MIAEDVEGGVGDEEGWWWREEVGNIQEGKVEEQASIADNIGWPQLCDICKNRYRLSTDNENPITAIPEFRQMRCALKIVSGGKKWAVYESESH